MDEVARPAFVLLVVIAMLALFATVALSFVFYAEAEATSSNYYSQSQTQTQADIDPELLLSYFLSQFIYDTDNLMSAMRGHSLARTMYGLSPVDYNVIPYNGEGRLFSQNQRSGQPDNIDLINFQYNPHDIVPDDRVRYPEIVDDFVTPFIKKSDGTLVTGATKILKPQQPFDLTNRYVGGNVPWTYPDVNNMFLAIVDSNNNVLMPSFSRHWTNETTPNRYTILRPRFYYDQAHRDVRYDPPDTDGAIALQKGNDGCDVKNLDNSPGRFAVDPTTGKPVLKPNDSIWMDLGFPVLTAPNGKKYKPLFASLVTDLDSKINLAIHGNISAPGNRHASHSGWSRSEVNLSKILPAGFMNLFKNPGLGNLDLQARYGFGGIPSGANPPLPQPLLSAPWYSRIDYDGLITQAPRLPCKFRRSTTALPLSPLFRVFGFRPRN